MSEKDHKVLVRKIKIAPHNNADALELALIDGYTSIVRKGSFVSGDLVAYIPEQSVVPDGILEELGLQGMLAGKAKNRVKAIRLRGVLSQGICYPAREGWQEGDDVTQALGIVKWEPPIPTHLSGKVTYVNPDLTLNYDIENFKSWPDVLQNGEEVVMTEKIHGTFCQIGFTPTTGDFFVASKGLGAKGLVFTEDNNEKNVYIRTVHALMIKEKLAKTHWDCEHVIICGEVFGRGVQDLSYSFDAMQKTGPGFRVFDIYKGRRSNGHFLSDRALDAICELIELERVPIIYRGPFSQEALEKHTSGIETVSGNQMHIREGVVVRPVIERRNPDLGRVQLKSVSDDYLLRKGGTEHN